MQNKKFTNNRFEELQLKDTLNVYMPADVKAKIKLLCSKISTIEWSGILVYDIEGDITNPKECRILLKDIVPMDKGSSSYTTYKLDPKIVMDYYMQNPENMDYSIGHIHSHHNMAVFFSGTDTDELHENAPNHNLYLSLIVNNKGEYACKLVFLGEVREACISFLDKDGESVSIGGGNSTEKKLVVYDCNIIEEVLTPELDKTFLEGVERIMKPKTVTYGRGAGVGFPSHRHGRNVASQGFRNNQRSQKFTIDTFEEIDDIYDSFDNPLYFHRWSQGQYLDEQEIPTLLRANEFVMQCLTLSKALEKETDISGIADAMASIFPTMSVDKVMQNISDRFFVVYGQIYPEDLDYESFDTNMADVLGVIRDASLEATTHRGLIIIERLAELVLSITKDFSDNE